MSTGSHYTVLARRFRPQAFDDVVGQEHVAQALRNAIRAGRVAHAYLFTGARGVGKTSTARILAKALNCPGADDGVPCNNCEICDGISTGNDVDVLEIDGASNRGIDDIRSLRANVNVRSMRTQFKLYIIDEVHMLTREAFNALLKTLEEPPPNVKFVFCTTEPNKVPDTILSRCQRFDFSAIGEESIGFRLKEIATAEGFEVEDEAIELVARRARGSMRDSQSLFDQLLAFSDGSVTANDVHRMLGTASDEMLVSMFEAITQHRPGEVLNILETALTAGVQAGELLDQCVGYVRDQMVTLSAGATASLCSVGAARRESVAQQAQTLGMPNVMAAFQILSEAKGRMMRSTFARVLLEMALVQISMLENLTALSSLLSGHLPALPMADNAQSSGVAIASGPADGEKKNPEVLEAVSPAATEPAAGSGPELEFSAENADRLLAEVISETAFTLSSAMKSVESIAISGPNGLELRLGAAYDFQKRVIEQSESCSAIQSIVSRLTGVDPHVTLKVVQDSPPPNTQSEVSSERPAPAQKAAESRKDPPSQVKNPAPLRVRDDIDPEQDAFVQQVVATFGARVVRVTDAPARRDIPDEEN
ncbi:MAG: DNA polymerase III subunit gamma/tau [Fuerstiella sp.]|nr:DNA polymerase III subunit gamma/tau [Fuerstiella sp.]MCP4853879.1 DNA polymerase III subunit gamma/tau [Fuerstiella sp.]